MILIYLLKLHSGKCVTDTLTYLARAEPLLARNGIEKLGYYPIESRIRGRAGVDPDIVQIATIEGPDSFDRLAADADYAQLIAFRDTIFDLEGCHCWLANDPA